MVSIKTIGKITSTRRWIYLECDENIGAYYRSLIKANLYNLKCRFANKMWPDVQKSIWQTHISILRIEDYNKLSQEVVVELWNKWDGELVEIEYEPIIKTDGRYFWLPVVSYARLSEIRQIFGLSKNPTPDYHMTVGNLIGLETNDEKEN